MLPALRTGNEQYSERIRYPSFVALRTVIKGSTRWRLGLVLLIAFLQGLLYLILLPPWQHYDEPTHFEYAWLIANRGHLPRLEEYDMSMRHQVALSMLRHQFYWNLPNLPKPDLSNSATVPWIGISELVHPPLYYLLVSVPLRFARHLDITGQLYVARAVSLLLFLVTIGAITSAMRELTAPNHPLQWAVPLAVAGIPTIPDLMTAVNNDVGAVCIFTLFLWAAVRILCHGPTWRSILALITCAGLAVFVKNTALGAVFLLPVVTWFCLRRYFRSLAGWSVLGVAGLIVALLASFQGGDAAYWYRCQEGSSSPGSTRTTIADTGIGRYALTVAATPNNQGCYLLNRVSSTDIRQLGGHQATYGGWIWASAPVKISSPGLLLSKRDTVDFTRVTQPVQVSTTPTFMAWTFTVPPTTGALYYAFYGDVEADQKPAQLFLARPILVRGVLPLDSAPTFSNMTATRGNWAGQSFTNLLRNPNAAQSWPRLRPWIADILVKLIRRSPAQLLTTLLDVQYTSQLLRLTLLSLIREFFGSFGWGQIRLGGVVWQPLLLALFVLCITGCIKWVIARKKRPRVEPALILLACAGLVVWLTALASPLPYLWSKIILPSARYTFPALLPTVLLLVGGWWALWPRRLRIPALFVLLGAVLMLDVAAVATIWSFYHSLPIT